MTQSEKYSPPLLENQGVDHLPSLSTLQYPKPQTRIRTLYSNHKACLKHDTFLTGSHLSPKIQLKPNGSNIGKLTPHQHHTYMIPNLNNQH